MFHVEILWDFGNFFQIVFPYVWVSLFSPHLIFSDTKHFCSILTDLSNLSLSNRLSKVPFARLWLENRSEKHFPKMQKQPFADVFQNKCSKVTCLKTCQGSTITIKSRHVITYVCQNFGVRHVRGQIPKSIYQVSYLLPNDFPNNFS